MRTYCEIVEKFTGKLTSCKAIASARFPNFPMGEYHLFVIKTASGTAGEVCLFKTYANISDPMSRSSEASPVYGAEQLSGKITDSCYSRIDKPSVIILTEDDATYCLYKLHP